MKMDLPFVQFFVCTNTCTAKCSRVAEGIGGKMCSHAIGGHGDGTDGQQIENSGDFPSPDARTS